MHNYSFTAASEMANSLHVSIKQWNNIQMLRRWKMSRYCYGHISKKHFNIKADAGQQCVLYIVFYFKM